jgi:8-oxo-dGTP pyrophosphatase MutT (NUDIX family)
MAVPSTFTKAPAKVDQACAIPFRRTNGDLEFCLITSSRGRWIFPKGFIDRGLTPQQTALMEAYEEAGLRGRILGEPIGFYNVEKDSGTYAVMALPMEVHHCADHWPEKDSRQRRWVNRQTACELLGQRELVEFIRGPLPS